MTDDKLAGEWRDVVKNNLCDQNVTNCGFVPNHSENQNIQCSLGNQDLVPGVTKYCDKINILPPTKHNALCQGASVQAIISNSQDVKSLPKHRASVRRTTPEIVTVQVGQLSTFIQIIYVYIKCRSKTLQPC